MSDRTQQIKQQQYDNKETGQKPNEMIFDAQHMIK